MLRSKFSSSINIRSYADIRGIASGLISPPMHPPRPALFREAGRAGRSGAAMHHAPPCRRVPPVDDTGAVAVPRIRRLWAARHAGEDVPACRRGCPGGAWGGTRGGGGWVVRGIVRRRSVRAIITVDRVRGGGAVAAQAGTADVSRLPAAAPPARMGGGTPEAKMSQDGSLAISRVAL